MAMAIGPNVVDDCEGITEEDYWRGMDEIMQTKKATNRFAIAAPATALRRRTGTSAIAAESRFTTKNPPCRQRRLLQMG